MEYSFYDLLKLLGALAMFLYGMKIMSEGLQKFAGDRLRSILTAMTTNRVTGVLTGVLITALIQSSSATTVMVVSFVNAGLLSLSQSIGVIMGANIGTTVTAWIISALGFKVDMAAMSLPLLAIGVPLLFSGKSSRKSIGEFIFGFSFLFMGLSLLKANAPDLGKNPEMLSFVQNYTDMGFASVILFVLIGTVLTMIVQASAATMAITLIMCANGWISFELGAALVLGENIGTTITANIAASVANTSAKRAALSHTVFNVFGVIWALILFQPFLALVGKIIELFGLPNPAGPDFMVQNANSEQGTAALYGLSMLHTLFNTINTFILIWFTGYIEKMVVAIIKTPANAESEVFRLKYIEAGPMSTPELSTEQAFSETIHFAQVSRNGLQYVRQAINEADTEKFEELRQKLVKYEEISDRIEYEIATFLNAVSAEEVSEHTSKEIKAMYKIIGELESLGDSGESISRILTRKNAHSKSFDETAIANLNAMVDMVDGAYDVMITNLTASFEGKLGAIGNAYEAEDRINDLRNTLRDAAIEEIEDNRKNYQTSVYYMDVVSELEKMGDFMINVSQALDKLHRN